MISIIDDVKNHATLLGIFRDLSNLLADGHYFGYRSESLFGGSADEVTALRNRVVRRLALLNDFQEAFEKAKERTGVK